jgi:hypothetical protein
MSRFISPVNKRLAALRLRLSQLQGKLKFAIRRGNKVIALNAIFEIESTEGTITYLESSLTPAQIIEMTPVSEWIAKLTPSKCDTPITVVTYDSYDSDKNCPNDEFKYLDFTTFCKPGSREYKFLCSYGYFASWNSKLDRTAVTALCCDLPSALPIVKPVITNSSELELELAFTIVRYHQYPYEKEVSNNEFKYLNILDFLASESDECEEKMLKKYGYFSTYNDTLDQRTITALCCDNPSYTPCVKEERVSFEVYLESLQLPRLKSKGNLFLSEATQARLEFVRQQMYKRVESDPTHPLLTFAPVLMQAHPFNTARYWVKNAVTDYAISLEMYDLATDKYYAIYPTPIYKGGIFNSDVVDSYIDSPCRSQTVAPGCGQNFFFCKNRTANRWEIWHYTNQEQLALSKC